MNELEKHLHSWVLRRPSPRVEQAIFGLAAPATAPASAPAVSVPALPAFSFRWLVPATAGLLLLCFIANPRAGSSLTSSTNSGPMVAMILSNQSAAAYLPGSFKMAENSVPADTFEWTNGSGSNSSMRSLLRPKGNE
jgi:hypothetical protein